ncbi:MAG: ROK family protein [Acidobacteriota bacterium]|nr:ROK family protein [Acidobacteriota bacterium]
MSDLNFVTIGIDLGGTTTPIAILDGDMNILSSRTIPTRVAAGPKAVVSDMAAVVAALLDQPDSQGILYAPIGIGIGSPGPINLRTGVLGLLPNFPGWDGFPLRDALIEATGLPVILESDANAAAIAEWKLGAGRATGLSSMAMLTLGTGVGSGLIINGEVWQGIFGMAGEVGHATIVPDGLACTCGSAGCLEMYASANGLVRLARAVAVSTEGTAAMRKLAGGHGDFTPLDIATLAQSGDRSAQLSFEQLGSYLGIGIANLISTLDLPLVVIGGGVATAWPLFVDSMFKAVNDHSMVYRLMAPSQTLLIEPGHTFICQAVLGPSAGLLGAALLPHLHGLAAPSISLSYAGLEVVN